MLEPLTELRNLEIRPYLILSVKNMERLVDCIPKFKHLETLGIHQYYPAEMTYGQFERMVSILSDLPCLQQFAIKVAIQDELDETTKEDQIWSQRREMNEALLTRMRGTVTRLFGRRFGFQGRMGRNQPFTDLN